MDSRPHRLALAAAFFVLWLGILYAGADHPPPRGFLWVVLLDLVASALVYLRVPTYAAWHAVRRPYRMLLVLRDGAITGFAFATATLFLSVATLGGAVAQGWDAVLIWLVVVTLVGAATAASLYAYVALAGRRRRA